MSLNVDPNLSMLSDPGSILVRIRLVPGLFNRVRIPEFGSAADENADGSISC
jgi:hypothetical protein